MNFLNILIISIVFSFTAFAGVGGSSGGPKVGTTKYIKVDVCDGGESGTMCRTVVYKNRGTAVGPVMHCYSYHGEATLEIPCAESGLIESVINEWQLQK
jgi:hypothetical protein